MRDLAKATISIIVPAHNEALNLKRLVDELEHSLKDFQQWKMLFIDDGSSDNTLEVLEELHALNKRVEYLSLSKNFGHQEALRAGLNHAEGDCVITMDADLQHPPELLPLLLKKWEEGHDVVYTIREEDTSLPLFKRVTSRLFYKVLNLLSDVKIDPHSSDFRLLDRMVVQALNTCEEKTIFWRGLIPWIGFRQLGIPYRPAARYAGETKYHFNKMLSLAMNGIISFGTKPLTFAVLIGAFIILLSMLYFAYALWTIYQGNAVPGWTSIIGTVLLIGGIQLFMLGVIGLYLGKTFNEVKRRPGHFIRTVKKN